MLFNTNSVRTLFRNLFYCIFFVVFLGGTSAIAGTIDNFDNNQLHPAWRIIDRTATLDAAVEESQNVLTIRAKGYELWGADNDFAGLWRLDITGDFDVWVKIISMTHTHDWAKAGILIANDVNNPAAGGYSLVGITPGNKGAFWNWDSDGDGTLDKNRNTNETVPFGDVWVRLKKEGRRVSAFYKYGINDDWIQIDQEQEINSVQTESQICLYVFSHNETRECTVVFDDFGGDGFFFQDDSYLPLTGGVMTDDSSHIDMNGADLFNAGIVDADGIETDNAYISGSVHGGSFIGDGSGLTNVPVSIGSGQITNNMISDSAVTSENLATHAVTESHLDQQSVTLEKINPSQGAPGQVLVNAGRSVEWRDPGSASIGPGAIHWEHLDYSTINKLANFLEKTPRLSIEIDYDIEKMLIVRQGNTDLEIPFAFQSYLPNGQNPASLGIMDSGSSVVVVNNPNLFQEGSFHRLVERTLCADSCVKYIYDDELVEIPYPHLTLSIDYVERRIVVRRTGRLSTEPFFRVYVTDSTGTTIAVVTSVFLPGLDYMDIPTDLVASGNCFALVDMNGLYTFDPEPVCVR